MGDTMIDTDPFDGERLDLPEWTSEMTALVLKPSDAQDCPAHDSDA